MVFFLNMICRKVSECSLIRRYEPLRPVISVGNIDFGGTGKTPHVIYIARKLLTWGKKVCVLTRGYKRQSKDFLFVDEGGTRLDHRLTGDEALLIKSSCPDTMIAIGANRRKSIEAALGKRDVDVFVMDDGFQQFFIKKTFDIVLVRYVDLGKFRNPINSFLRREPHSSLNNSDLVVVTKAPEDFDLEYIKRSLAFLKRGKNIALSTYRVKNIVDNEGVVQSFSPGKEFFLFGGIGDFAGLKNSVTGAGYTISGEMSLQDHVNYTDRLWEEIKHSSGSKALLTTQKDLVKLPYKKFGTVYALEVEVEMLMGESWLDDRLKMMVAHNG